VRRDGEALAFVAGNLEGLLNWGNIAPSAIWVVVAGHAAVRVTDTTSLNASPAWLPDGSLLFVSDRDGARDIYALRIDRAGHHRETAARLTIGAGVYRLR
jgi:Tol biopolymer transport system component